METQQVSAQIYLSDNIRFLRKQMDLSQEELAMKVGLNRGNIASYEKGTAEPKLCNLLSISKFFNISLLDLTQRNLQNYESVPLSQNGHAFSDEEKPLLEEYFQRARELNEVLESLNCYHCYKKKTLDEMPKDMQMLVFNFEKLFEVAQVLMGFSQRIVGFYQVQVSGKPLW